jgi:hypothetical protein
MADDSVRKPNQLGNESQQVQERLAAENQLKSGASWFFWIAGLSVVNSILVMTGSEWSFIIGLGLTQVIDALTREAGPATQLAGFAVDLLIAGVFVLFGFFARQGKPWSFWVGMIVYTLDGILFLMVPDWLSIGFHVFALYCIWNGLRAHNRLRQMDELGVVTG